jgi:hypothetical protein
MVATLLQPDTDRTKKERPGGGLRPWRPASLIGRRRPSDHGFPDAIPLYTAMVLSQTGDTFQKGPFWTGGHRLQKGPVRMLVRPLANNLERESYFQGAYWSEEYS